MAVNPKKKEAKPNANVKPNDSSIEHHRALLVDDVDINGKSSRKELLLEVLGEDIKPHTPEWRNWHWHWHREDNGRRSKRMNEQPTDEPTNRQSIHIQPQQPVYLMQK